MDHIELASDQLVRMRGMTAYYHDRFFADMRVVVAAVLSLFVLGWSVAPEAFLLVPVVALVGANQAAFDASYLLFARHYAARLEGHLNRHAGVDVLVASHLEAAYLFQLDTKKVVTIGFGGGFTWFGWMTILYTILGVLAAAAGLALGLPTLEAAGPGWAAFYLVSLVVVATASIVVGVWWFVLGEGESRLRETLDDQFDRSRPRPVDSD